MQFQKFLNFLKTKFWAKNDKKILTLIFLIFFIPMIFFVKIRLDLTEKKNTNEKLHFDISKRCGSFGMKLCTKYSFISVLILSSVTIDYVLGPEITSLSCYTLCLNMSCSCSIFKVFPIIDLELFVNIVFRRLKSIKKCYPFYWYLCNFTCGQNRLLFNIFF